MADRTKKKLYRSRDNRVIAGVCGGIAEWLGWDPTVVRVLYVLLSIFSAAFPGILVYLLLWAIIPEEPVARVDVGREITEGVEEPVWTERPPAVERRPPPP